MGDGEGGGPRPLRKGGCGLCLGRPRRRPGGAQRLTCGDTAHLPRGEQRRREQSPAGTPPADGSVALRGRRVALAGRGPPGAPRARPGFGPGTRPRPSAGGRSLEQPAGRSQGGRAPLAAGGPRTRGDAAARTWPGSRARPGGDGGAWGLRGRERGRPGSWHSRAAAPRGGTGGPAASGGTGVRGGAGAGGGRASQPWAPSGGRGGWTRRTCPGEGRRAGAQGRRGRHPGPRGFSVTKAPAGNPDCAASAAQAGDPGGGKALPRQALDGGDGGANPETWGWDGEGAGRSVARGQPFAQRGGEREASGTQGTPTATAGPRIPQGLFPGPPRMPTSSDARVPHGKWPRTTNMQHTGPFTAQTPGFTQKIPLKQQKRNPQMQRADRSGKGAAR